MDCRCLRAPSVACRAAQAPCTGAIRLRDSETTRKVKEAAVAAAAPSVLSPDMYINLAGYARASPRYCPIRDQRMPMSCDLQSNRFRTGTVPSNASTVSSCFQAGRS